MRDWRANCRIANIDVSLLIAGTKAVVDNMIDAYYRTRRRPGTKVIYCNQTVVAALHKEARGDSQVLSIAEFAGKPVVSFLGIPIREVDAILNTEGTVA